MAIFHWQCLYASKAEAAMSVSCRRMDGAVASRILLLPVCEKESPLCSLRHWQCLARISPAAPVALITILGREVVLYSALFQDRYAKKSRLVAFKCLRK